MYSELIIFLFFYGGTRDLGATQNTIYIHFRRTGERSNWSASAGRWACTGDGRRHVCVEPESSLVMGSYSRAVICHCRFVVDGDRADFAKRDAPVVMGTPCHDRALRWNDCTRNMGGGGRGGYARARSFAGADCSPGVGIADFDGNRVLGIAARFFARCNRSGPVALFAMWKSHRITAAL